MDRFKLTYILAASMYLLLPACGDSTTKKQAWIVLDFVLKDGKTAQMAFNNPAVPDMTKAECEDSLPKAQESLVRVAIEKEPSLAQGKLTNASCVMSADDPIKPR